jgi:hypothetical protein
VNPPVVTLVSTSKIETWPLPVGTGVPTAICVAPPARRGATTTARLMRSSAGRLCENTRTQGSPAPGLVDRSAVGWLST